MNPNNDMTGLPDGHRLSDDRRRIERLVDRLVDGELSPAERRDVILHLEEAPAGWRRCALAFLEAQGWREEFGSIVRPAAPSVGSMPAAPHKAALSRFPAWRSTLLTGLAVAASFLVAFVLGMHIRGGGAGPNGERPIESLAATVGEAAPGPESRQAAIPGPPRLPAAPSDRWQLVTLKAPEGPEGKMATIRVPAVERNALDEQWLESFPMAVPDEVLQRLRRSGLEVQQHRELLPMEMQDGRRLVVPMDRIEVRYVGRPAL